MSILVDNDTRALVLGLTGRAGLFHSKIMMAYGTHIVGGVTPGKGGSNALQLPVFNTVKEAVAGTDANTCIITVPPPFAADAIMEVADAGVRLCVAVTNGIPAQDMIRVKRYMKRYRAEKRMRLIGPSSAGVISPGKTMVGIMPHDIYEAGRVGIVSRSGTLGYEAAAQLKALGIGVSTSVEIGGDQINGSSFIDILELFEKDADTDGVILLGEIGGPQEAAAAEYIHQYMSKPVVAYVAGLNVPHQKKMGHAAAIISAFGDSATEKIELLRTAGVTIVPLPSKIGSTAQEVIVDVSR